MPASTATETLQLSPISAQQLAKFLRQLIEELRTDGNVSTLCRTEEQLDGAIWIAQWLREDVKLELNGSQAFDLLEALVVRLDEDTWSDDDVDLLTNLVNQLQSGFQRVLEKTDHTSDSLLSLESMTAD